MDLNSEKKVFGESVTSVGNSWVICRSKSYSGRIYYFNTLTGEAAWNLSNSEVEKAKSTIKQQGMIIEGCPEPKGPPDQTERHSHNGQQKPIAQSKVYNKQIINNQFSKPYTLTPFVIPACNMISQNNTCLNPNLSTNFNSHVWAIPPNHQYFMAATPTPMVNQATINLPFSGQDHTMSIQNTSMPLSSRFQLLHNTTKRYPQRCFKKYNNFTPRSNNNQFPWKNERNSFNNKSRISDLRNILTAKRYEEFSQQSMKHNEESKDNMSMDRVTYSKHQNNDTAGHTNSDSLENTNEYQIDVTKLKKLAKPNTDPDCWYIVADKNIFLNHLNYLNILLNADDQCTLMVPKDVLAELQSIVDKGHAIPRMMSRARRAVQFLKHQSEIGCAGIDENSYHSKSEFKEAYVMDCCLNLVQENYHVILLTNDEVFKTCNTEAKIPIFTVKEIKHFLARTDCSGIKIIVPNDLVDRHKTQLFSSRGVQSADDVSCNNNESSPCDISKANKAAQCNSLSMKQINAKVQTDLTILQTANNPVQTVSLPQSENKNPHDITFNTESNKSQKIFELPTTKRREIKLKRNTFSNENIAINNNILEKKQFKWRKKRNTTTSSKAPEVHKESAESVINCALIASCESYLSSEKQSACHNSNESLDIPTDDAIAASDTSSCIMQRVVTEKIIIEETSTSGIISNTDSENESAKQTKINLDTCVKQSILKNVMFEVTNRTMSDYLSMRCDEWISRFIQIMEEALTEVLCGTPTLSSLMPPPLTLQEAAGSIKMKFKNNYGVVDTADKLINILAKISNTRGGIDEDLSPTRFMEMYSYGVHLINSLQSALPNFEDLQIAEKSLTKLLKDIQEPPDTGHSDALGNFHDSLFNTTRLPERKTENIDEKATPEPQMMQESKATSNNHDNIEPGTYYLRSKKKNVGQDQNMGQDNIKFIRNIDIEATFFNTLNLQRKHGNNDLVMCNEIGLTQNVKSVSEHPLCSKDLGNYINEQNEITKHVKNDEKDNAGPIIIRKFSTCPEIEARLCLKKQNEQLDIHHLNNLDNNERIDYDEFDFELDENKGIICNKAAIEQIHEREQVYDDDTSFYDNTHWILRKPLKDIKDAFTEINIFCVQTAKELNNSAEITSRRRIEILDKAEKAHVHIANLCKNLNRIFSRETYGSENFHTLLKNEGIGLNENQSVMYRDIIAKSANQAKVLLECVDCIITAVKNHI